MTREEYDALIPADALEELKLLCGNDPQCVEETLQEQYEMYLEENDL